MIKKHQSPSFIAKNVPLLLMINKAKPNVFWSIFSMNCPHCRHGRMYRNSNPWNLKKVFDMPEKCEECGQPFELECEGLLAIALQHETDHLDGTVFVDHLSSLKRELIRRRMKKLKAEHASEKPEDVKKAAQHRSAL